MGEDWVYKETDVNKLKRSRDLYKRLLRQSIQASRSGFLQQPTERAIAIFRETVKVLEQRIREVKKNR